MSIEKKIDILWDDNPVDISSKANFIWSIANKLRGTYMLDRYADVIICNFDYLEVRIGGLPNVYR